MPAVDPAAAARHPSGMIRAFVLSVGQLGDRRVLAVLAKSLAVTIALFAALGLAAFFPVRAAIGALLGPRADGTFAAIAVLLLGIGAAWLLFRVVAIAIIGVFADDVVAAVEARHYPAAFATARHVRFARSVRMGIGSALRAVAVNVLLAPAYLALALTGIGAALLFLAVNGWLLGRDLGDMAASRHLDDAAMRGWRKATRGRRFALGLAATGLFVVPVLNILAPILGAAMATHLFHGGKA